MKRPSFKNRPWVILLALLIDLIFGDPPNRFHPVAWMGSAIGWARRHAPQTGNRVQFLYGVGLVGGGTLLVAGSGWLLARGLQRSPQRLSWWPRLQSVQLMQVAVLLATLQPKPANSSPMGRTCHSFHQLRVRRHSWFWILLCCQWRRATKSWLAAHTIFALNIHPIEARQIIIFACHRWYAPFITVSRTQPLVTGQK